MGEDKMHRREFLIGSGAVATAALLGRTGAFANPVPGPYPYHTFSKDLELPEPRRLAEVEAMTPAQIARSSRLVTTAYDDLLKIAASLENPAYRQVMTGIVAKPKLTFLGDLYPSEKDRQKIVAEMVARGYSNAEDPPDYLFPSGSDEIQNMLTAPQSHNDWYGSHPGGMALVVAFNKPMSSLTAMSMACRSTATSPPARLAFMSSQRPGSMPGNRTEHIGKNRVPSTASRSTPTISMSPLK
jgi:hypothetical protein